MSTGIGWTMIVPLAIIALMCVGPILLIIGALRRDRFTSPVCRKCRYDLRGQLLQAVAERPLNNAGTQEAKVHDLLHGRTCQECGADLGTRRAVLYGTRPQGVWAIVIIGGLLTLAPPALSLAGVAFALMRQSQAVGVQPHNMSQQTTAVLIQNITHTQYQPWVWQELDNRLNAANLTQAEINQALQALAASITAQRQAGQQVQYLHYADQFIRSLMQRPGATNSPEFAALVETFYDAPRALLARTKVRADQPLQFELDGQGHGNLHNTRMVTAVAEARTADGQTLKLRSTHNSDHGDNPDWLSFDRGWNVQFQVPADQLPPGKHEVTITCDHGAVPDNTVYTGVDGRPGQKRRWPNPYATWRRAYKHTVEVVPIDTSPLLPVTDAKLAPTGLKPPQLVARKGNQHAQLVVQFVTQPGDVGVPIGADVFIIPLDASGQPIADRRHEVGALSLRPQLPHRRGYTMRLPDAIPTQTTAARVELVPNPRRAENQREATTYWAQPIVFDNVPLERHDLD